MARQQSAGKVTDILGSPQMAAGSWLLQSLCSSLFAVGKLL